MAILLYVGYVFGTYQYELHKPVEWIFEAHLIVPDFKSGENPAIDYERTIWEDFRASPLVEIKNASDGTTECRTDDPVEYSYERGEKMKAKNKNLQWYTQASCLALMPPGEYYVETNYILKRTNLPDRSYTVRSNVFKIS